MPRQVCTDPKRVGKACNLMRGPVGAWRKNPEYRGRTLICNFCYRDSGLPACDYVVMSGDSRVSHWSHCDRTAVEQVEVSEEELNSRYHTHNRLGRDEGEPVSPVNVCRAHSPAARAAKAAEAEERYRREKLERDARYEAERRKRLLAESTEHHLPDLRDLLAWAEANRDLVDNDEWLARGLHAVASIVEESNG